MTLINPDHEDAFFINSIKLMLQNVVMCVKVRLKSFGVMLRWNTAYTLMVFGMVITIWRNNDKIFY